LLPFLPRKDRSQLSTPKKNQSKNHLPIKTCAKRRTGPSNQAPSPKKNNKTPRVRFRVQGKTGSNWKLQRPCFHPSAKRRTIRMHQKGLVVFMALLTFVRDS